MYMFCVQTGRDNCKLIVVGCSELLNLHDDEFSLRSWVLWPIRNILFPVSTDKGTDKNDTYPEGTKLRREAYPNTVL